MLFKLMALCEMMGRRCREMNFLKKVHQCVENGGKVLIPVFALGRAQELCILLETYWERNKLKCPIYFAAGLTEKVGPFAPAPASAPALVLVLALARSPAPASATQQALRKRPDTGALVASREPLCSCECGGTVKLMP